MSGPNTNNSTATQNSQAGIGQQLNQEGQQALTQMNTLEQTPVNYWTRIANAAQSGNYGDLITAAGLPISQITQQSQQAQENVYNTMPAGAGRDAALAAGKLNTGQQVASTLGQTYTGAINQLQNIASGYGSLGLQETGASLSGFSGASATQSNIMNAQNQSKASTMGFLGSLAGAAGTAAGGGAFGSLGGGGSATSAAGSGAAAGIDSVTGVLF